MIVGHFGPYSKTFWGGCFYFLMASSANPSFVVLFFSFFFRLFEFFLVLLWSFSMVFYSNPRVCLPERANGEGDFWLYAKAFVVRFWVKNGDPKKTRFGKRKNRPIHLWSPVGWGVLFA